MRLKLLVLILTIAFATSVGAHVGTTTFMPTVPDPSAMTIDGLEDDWDWYDPGFAITPDQLVVWLGQYEGAQMPVDDFSAGYFIAWSAPPDNRLYFFARVTDDTLRSAGGDDHGLWWADDFIQISIDADHSGGNHLGDTIESLENGQRWEQVPAWPGPCNIGGVLEFEHQEDWLCTEPYTYLAVTVSPSDATHMTPEIEYTYEFAMTLFDFFAPIDGIDASVVHVFEPEQVIHASIRFDDADQDEGQGGQSLIGLAGGSYLGDREGEQSGDYVAIQTVDDLPGSVITAVEHKTWAAIKSYTTRNLRR
jgi:hypothetical protein